MFELFIALFGGAYYLARFADDKAKSRAYTNKRNYNEMCFSKVSADFEAVFQAEQRLRNSETCDEALQSIEPELRYVFGEHWQEKYKKRCGNSSVESKLFTYSVSDERGDPWWVATQLLLARDGKVAFTNSMHKLVGTPEMIDAQMRTFKMIEKEIQKEHPTYHIVVDHTIEYGRNIGWITWEYK